MHRKIRNVSLGSNSTIHLWCDEGMLFKLPGLQFLFCIISMNRLLIPHKTFGPLRGQSCVSLGLTRELWATVGWKFSSFQQSGLRWLAGFTNNVQAPLWQPSKQRGCERSEDEPTEGLKDHERHLHFTSAWPPDGESHVAIFLCHRALASRPFQFSQTVLRHSGMLSVYGVW